MSPIPAPPMPQSDDPASVFKALLDGQAALLQGVNDIRANVVTRQQLHAFHELQSTEMRTYVQAELAPIHNHLRQQSAHVGVMVDRVAQVESRMASLTVSEARPEIHDPARRRISFIGFPESSTIADRISSMEAFMREHFPEIKPVSVNLFASKDGRPSIHGFVECCSPQQARMILESIKTRELHIAAHANVQIKPALTDIDRNRNWAIHAAEQKIKASSLSHGKLVTVKKGGANRGVYVDNVVAFTQADRHARGGLFVGEYSNLSLS